MLFDDLPVGSFDGVEFPVLDVTFQSGSAAAFHKFVYRPGQLIEPTGREPLHGTINIAIFNSLRASKAQVEWPGTIYRLREKAQQQRLGALTIPPFGTMPKAMIRLSEKYDGAARDGCYASIEFFEDSRSELSLGNLTNANFDSCASALDTFGAKLALMGLKLDSLTVPTQPGFVSLFDALGQLRTALDDLKTDLTGPIRLMRAIQYELDKLAKSIRDFDNPVDWDFTSALLDLKASLLDIEQNSIASKFDVVRFIAAGDMTVQGVASATGNRVEDIVLLNPGVDLASIPGGTVLQVVRSL